MKWFPLLFLAVLVAGCNSEDAGDLQKDVGRLAKTGGRALGNAQVVARVNAALVQRKGVDVSGIHVEAKEGVVTLGGHVRTADEKKRVIETTNEIRGVEKVIDKLRIEPASK